MTEFYKNVFAEWYDGIMIRAFLFRATAADVSEYFGLVPEWFADFDEQIANHRERMILDGETSDTLITLTHHAWSSDDGDPCHFCGTKTQWYHNSEIPVCRRCAGHRNKWELPTRFEFLGER